MRESICLEGQAWATSLAMGKLFHLSVPYFPHLENGVIIITELPSQVVVKIKCGMEGNYFGHPGA